MPWPATVVVQPDDRPALVGSRWKRYAPAGDAWDRVVVRGVYSMHPDQGSDELVIQTEDFGEPVSTTDVESFAAAYKRVEDDDPAQNLAQRVRAIEERLGRL